MRILAIEDYTFLITLKGCVGNSTFNKLLEMGTQHRCFPTRLRIGTAIIKSDETDEEGKERREYGKK